MRSDKAILIVSDINTFIELCHLKKLISRPNTRDSSPESSRVPTYKKFANQSESSPSVQCLSLIEVSAVQCSDVALEWCGWSDPALYPI